MCYERRVLFEELGERLVLREEAGSTNDVAIDLALRGADSGLVVLAERQVAGRGRRGAGWFCGAEEGLAFSVLLRPTFERALWPRLALVAGLAVARALEKMGVLAEVKWPNDVLLNGKKVCGILVESEGDAVVVGIGVNVGTRVFPEAIRATATSLFLAMGGALSRESVLLEIVAQLDGLVPQLGRDFAGLVRMLRERCALEGKDIELTSGGVRRGGRCLGIGAGGELLVEWGGVVHQLIQADEIRVVREG